MSIRRTLTAALVASLALAAACGQGSPSGQPATSATPATTAVAGPGAATPPAVPGRKVEVTADDTMKFSVLEIRAKAGERLSVTLINKGTTPKFSMGHNWVLLTVSADVDAFLAAATEAAVTDYVPAGKRAEVLATTTLLGPTEQDTATFVVPAAPGRYPFVCSFPGHAAVGMRGVLIVE